MMMTQETALLKAEEQFQRLVAYVQQKQAGRLDQVERHLFAETMRLCARFWKRMSRVRARRRRCAHRARRPTLSADREAGAAVRVDLWGIGNLPLVYAPRKGQKQYAPFISAGIAGGRIFLRAGGLAPAAVREPAFGEACTSLADLLVCG